MYKKFIIICALIFISVGSGGCRGLSKKADSIK